MCCDDNLGDVLLFFFFKPSGVIPSLSKCLFLTFLSHSPSMLTGTFSVLSLVSCVPCVPLPPVSLFVGSCDCIFEIAPFTVVMDLLCRQRKMLYYLCPSFVYVLRKLTIQ